MMMMMMMMMMIVIVMVMMMKIEALACNDPSSGDDGFLLPSSPSRSLP
jgi:hypothetical protein